MENEYKEILGCFDNVTCLGVWYITWDIWKDKSKNEKQLVQLFKVTNAPDDEYSFLDCRNCILTFDGREFRRHWGTLDVAKAWRTNSIDESFDGCKDAYLSHMVSTPAQLLKELLSDRVLNEDNIIPHKLLDLYTKISRMYYVEDLQFPVFEYPTRTKEAGKEAIQHAREIDTYR